MKSSFAVRAVVVLLAALCCSASAFAFSYRTVTLKAGDGTGSDIVISSANAANVALDRQSATEGQFYEEDGTVWFCAPYLPASFTAPTGKVFTGWSDGYNTFSPGLHMSASGNVTLTAQWADDGDAKLLSIVPSQGTLSPAFDPDEYNYNLDVYYDGTPLSVTLTATPRDPAATVTYDDDDTCPSLNEDKNDVYICVTNGANSKGYYVLMSVWYSISIITQGQGTAKTYFYYGGEETSVGFNEALIKLVATPATGYHFDHWELVSGNGTLSNATSQNDGRYRIGTDNAVVRAVFAFDGSDLSLSDTDDNTATLATFDGSLVNLTLQGRTLTTDGSWQTLCLPFDVPDLTGTPLEGFDVVELDTENQFTVHNSQFTVTGFEAGTLHLNFTPATSITAGKPYLVKRLHTTQDTSTPTYTATNGTDGFMSNFGYANLIDGTTSNRWRPTFTSGVFCEFHAPKAVDVTGYVLTSGNMVTTYDPKAWTLKAKRRESDAWTIIDSRNALENASDALPDTRTATKTYTLDADKQGAYQYFRFEVQQNGGATQMIITNLALQGSYTPVAVNITNPIFEVVTINGAAPTPVTSQDGKVSFVGTYAPVTLEDNKTTLHLTTGNTLTHATTATTVGPQRALFHLLDGVEAGTTATIVGDIDGDGLVTVADVTTVANIAVGKGYVPTRVRIVDGNGNLLYK